jgi:hypothetical protein
MATADLHPITQMAIERGSGALEPNAQAVGHYGCLQFDLARAGALWRAEKTETLRLEYEALAKRVADVRAALAAAGILAKHDRIGGPAHHWREQILWKGWTIPS